MANPRLYAFDLEGTLTLHGKDEHAGKHYYPSDWPLIAEALGPECLAEENTLTELWNRQQGSEEQKRLPPEKQLVGTYVDYMWKTIDIHKKYGLTMETFEKVVNGVPFIYGVRETFKAIKSHNQQNRIAVISGGFMNRVERMPGSEYVDDFRVACNYHFDGEGRLASWDLKEYDLKGKVHALHEIAQEHGIDVAHDTYFVGDGKNDIAIMEAVAHPIAMNPHPDLAKRAKQLGGHVVNSDNLQEAIPILGLRD